jgi:hypothetical protein
VRILIIIKAIQWMWELHNTKECQIEKNSASENSDFIGAQRDA